LQQHHNPLNHNISELLLQPQGPRGTSQLTAGRQRRGGASYGRGHVRQVHDRL